MAGGLFCVCCTTQCTQWALNMATRLTLESEVMGQECLTEHRAAAVQARPWRGRAAVRTQVPKSLAAGAGLATELEIRE